MWTWLRAHAVPFYGTYWDERGFREYEFIFGNKPFDGLDLEKFRPGLTEAMRRHLQKTSTHWGQGKLNPSTIAWVIRRTEEELTLRSQPLSPMDPAEH
jgi:hypothetical protein